MSKYFPTTITALFVVVHLLNIPTNGYGLDLQSQVDPLAKQLLADKHAVGFVVGIYKDGETQVIGYGETVKGKGIAPNGDTIYEIGSASKAFTGVLLADLVQRGRVTLDDPLQTHLPDAAKSQLKNPTNITLEHLATHTSGLPRLPDNLKPADPMNPYADYTFQQMFAFLKDHKPRRVPGQYEYSNLGMGLLGVLLAGREGKSYEDLLVDQIAKPCGMNDTRVNLSDQKRQRLAPPYNRAMQPAKNWDLPTLTGAGGIRSSTNDMLKFVAANLANDDRPLTKAMQLSHQKRHTMSDGQAIGLAWHIHPDGVTRWHNGRTGGYASWVAVVPGRNVGVVVLCNTAATEIDDIGQKITQIALGGKAEYLKLAPYTGVRWEGDKPVVKIGEEWLTLVSLDAVAVENIVAFSRRTYQDGWRKRFEEDLVEVLAGMGHEPKGTVELVVSPPGSSEKRTLKDVPMTTANRQVIKAAADKTELAKAPSIVQVAPDVLRKYVGVYAITPQFILTVTLERDQLMVQATGQQKHQVYPESETKFFYKVVDAQLTFAGDKNGKAELLILHQNGANQVATRPD